MGGGLGLVGRGGFKGPLTYVHNKERCSVVIPIGVDVVRFACRICGRRDLCRKRLHLKHIDTAVIATLFLVTSCIRTCAVSDHHTMFDVA